MTRFPPRVRLHSANEFTAVFEQGRRLQEAPLTAVFRLSQAAPRLGLAIARKAVPLASERNRIKRQVRESFRLAHAQLPQVDIVILARPQAGAAANPALRHALARVWTRIAEQCRAS
jgi:ribonuclease P protein component